MLSKKTFTAARQAPLEELLVGQAGLSPQAAREAVERGAVKVDGRIADGAAQVRKGARIAVRLGGGAAGAAGESEGRSPEPRLIYRDEWVCVVDKPPGMLAQRGPAGADSLDRFVARRLGPAARPMHRLDLDASGLVLCAVQVFARAPLQKALVEGRIERRYLAVVGGHLEGEGQITRSIGVDPLDRRRRRALGERDPGGEPASSRYRALSVQGETTTVELTLETGRTHQLRVHLSCIGHPIAGDRLYGGAPAPRLMLHAHELAFPHPEHGAEIRVRSELPW